MKSYLLSAMFLTVISMYAQFPTTSLTVSYPFTNGSTNDVSGSNNHLTTFNGPTPCADRFNNPNCAYLFDGVNDYMKAINPGTLNKKSRSIVFWAKTTATFNSSGYAVLYYGDENSSGARIECGLNSNCNSFYIDYGNGFISTPFATTDNMWHMYAAVYDSTISNNISSVKHYVDGNLLSTTCASYSPSQSINTMSTDPIYIGKFSNSLPRYFNGAIDDIHVWERPLTPGEIITIYNLPNTVVEDQLAGADIVVFPNPAKDQLQIKGFKDCDIAVFNALGQKIISEMNVATQISVKTTDLPKGIYFVRVSNEKGSITKKIVKD